MAYIQSMLARPNPIPRRYAAGAMAVHGENICLNRQETSCIRTMTGAYKTQFKCNRKGKPNARS